MNAANKSRWGFLIPALFVALAGLFVGMVALLVLPSAHADGPLDQPLLTHESHGVTISDDSWVMQELARKPVWSDPRCNCGSYLTDRGPSLHYLRALMIVRGGDDLPPLQPLHLRRAPYVVPADPVLRNDPGLLRTVIPRQPPP